MNIWDWAYENRVQITDIDGNIYRGNVIDIGTAEEEGQEEDVITLECFSDELHHYIFGFTPSRIKSIEHY